ncbi:MAG TPA: IS481 family transposase [Thermoanaerobaculia bacterium]
MDQREEMVLMWLSGKYTAAEVAERFETSRTTLYDWTGRYRANGRGGLEDRPPIAKTCPHHTSANLEDMIIEARQRYGWGPKKLRVKLVAAHPNLVWPQPSTIGDILKRNSLIADRRRRRKTSTPFRRKYQPTAAGELTTVDFKGQFKTLDGIYCYPLTMMDLTSRFLLACRALRSTAFEGVWPIFRQVFREYGMPWAVQSDNGVPFVNSNALARISRLSVKLMKLGIQPVINDPGHPEQNGAHERMHATLAAATTRPPARNQREQQKSFDGFQSLYNDERPHEALGQAVPSSKFSGSSRPFPEKEPKLEYPSHLEIRLVSGSGRIKFNNRSFFLSDALNGERVGLEAVDEGVWSVQFGQFEIARLDERSGEIV